MRLKKSKDFFIIAHNIRSLHNVGSIFRTADAFGVAKIYLTGYTGRPDFYVHKNKIGKVALDIIEKYTNENTKESDFIFPIIKNKELYLKDKQYRFQRACS